MNRLELTSWVAAMTLSLVLATRTGDAQDADTLSISGTFHMDRLEGTVGADLGGVFARGGEHWWSLTLHGVTYSYEAVYGVPYEFDEQYVTRVHATAFDFQLFGPDEDSLNQALTQQLVRGSLGDGAFLELRNVYTYWGGDYWFASWDLGLSPLDPETGLSFLAGHGGLYLLFPWDVPFHPTVDPQRLPAERTVIADRRPGASGELVSLNDAVDIGSSGPPAPPALSLADGQVLEGNRGASRLLLTVTLSAAHYDRITVAYRTEDGTAGASSDYYATSGTLTFRPGETSQTIEVFIRSDRRREANETFTVRLSNAAGATIGDAVGTITVVNDD